MYNIPPLLLWAAPPSVNKNNIIHKHRSYNENMYTSYIFYTELTVLMSQDKSFYAWQGMGRMLFRLQVQFLLHAAHFFKLPHIKEGVLADGVHAYFPVFCHQLVRQVGHMEKGVFWDFLDEART